MYPNSNLIDLIANVKLKCQIQKTFVCEDGVKGISGCKYDFNYILRLILSPWLYFVILFVCRPYYFHKTLDLSVMGFVNQRKTTPYTMKTKYSFSAAFTPYFEWMYLCLRFNIKLGNVLNCFYWRLNLYSELILWKIFR